MNSLEPNSSPHPIYKSIRFDDFDVTWAGPNPLGPGFCFGSDDGRLRFTDEEGSQIYEPFPAVESGEAINGVAIHDGCLAISSRSNLKVLWIDQMDHERVPSIDFSIGCHDVIACSNGYFVAPCGGAGYALMNPQIGAEQELHGMHCPHKPLYFYKVVSLRSSKGSEAMAFAVRRDGIAIIPTGGVSEYADLALACFESLDVVDVCAIESDSTAFAAISSDGTLILFQDALTDKKPLTIKWDAIRGTVYRVLSCRGHVFVLTSVALYMLEKLGDRCVHGDTIEGRITKIVQIPIEAADAQTYGEKYLLVVTADEVQRFDIGLMEQLSSGNDKCEVRDVVPTVVKPYQQWRVLSHQPRAAAGVV